MRPELLSDEKFEELLNSRAEPLTKHQEFQLQQIRRTVYILNNYEEDIDKNLRNKTLSIFKQEQMEILRNDKDEPWEEFIDSLPEEIQDVIDV